MDVFTIDNKNHNNEVFAKIANSIVRKYNCRVKYDHDTGQLLLSGEESDKSVAIEELREFLEKE